MSCYNWERGTITIPTKEWSKFRTTLIKAWNEHQLAKLEKAKKLHAELTAAIKGKRGSKRTEALQKAVRARFERCGRTDMLQEIRDMLVEGWGDQMTLRPLPKKKDLGLLPTSKTCSLQLQEATITLNNTNRTVTWNVEENNRAVESARKEKLAQVLFRLLDKITWTRGSGGKIIGNDEYNSDSDYEGGGGNYVTAEYSQAKQKRDREARARTPRSSYYGGGLYGRW